MCTAPTYQHMKTVLIGILLYATMVYIVGVSIYEMIVGSKAAAVVIDNYDYSYNGTISINALPRDVYENTKSVAGIFIGMGSVALLACMASICVMFVERKMWYPNVVILFIANCSMSVCQFTYGAFVVWKYNSLRTSDKELWDTVDRRFMEIFSEMYKSIILTSLPSLLSVIGGIYYFLKEI